MTNLVDQESVQRWAFYHAKSLIDFLVHSREAQVEISKIEAQAQFSLIEHASCSNLTRLGFYFGETNFSRGEIPYLDPNNSILLCEVKGIKKDLVKPIAGV